MADVHCGGCKVLIPAGALAFRIGIDRVVIDPSRSQGARIANLLILSTGNDWHEPKVAWVCAQCYDSSVDASSPELAEQS